MYRSSYRFLFANAGNATDPCAAPEHDGYNVNSHIVALVGIFAASLAGILLPIIGKRMDSWSLPDFSLVVGKCLATGVIMGVALVHLLVPANESLTHKCAPKTLREWGPVAYAICAGAIFLMHACDLLTTSLLSSCFVGEVEGSHGEQSPLLEDHSHPESRYERHGHAHGLVLMTSQTGGTCVRTASIQFAVSAILLELGVSLHSVFVGLAVAFSGDNDLFAFASAVYFHQFFEGIALGSRLADASLSQPFEAVLAAVFTFSAPLGAAAGIALAANQSLNTNGALFLATQGLLDALCAGILLYLGFGLLLVDFPQDLRHRCPGTGGRCAMLLSLWAGAAAMVYISKYA